MKLEFDHDGNLKLPKSSAELNKLSTKSLDFLKDEQYKKPEREFWNLHVDGVEVDPLVFSNGKTQEDVIKEIVGLVKDGTKIIFLKGACGTGKSAIALNLARLLGKTSIIVPIKNLQRQYEEDYTSKKFLVKSNGIRLKIAVLTGRNNHASRFISGSSCADPELPDNINVRDSRKWHKLKEYFELNPNNSDREIPEIGRLTRSMIAPANPYWSPIREADAEISFDYSEKIDYLSSTGENWAFYWRKKGCGYYDQYVAYAKADVLVFNSAKYLAELSLGRKPATEIEIFDEGDEFLDKLFQQKTINLDQLSLALTALQVKGEDSKKTIRKMVELIGLELKNKRILGVDKNRIYNIGETKIKELFKLFRASGEVNYEISVGNYSYAKEALEAAADLKEVIDDVYLNYSIQDDEVHMQLACTNISSKIDRLKKHSKVLVFMSGTIHSERILKEVFGFKEFKTVEAEHINPGSVSIKETGKEFKCNYQNIQANRGAYFRALAECILTAKKPLLVQVSAFSDLPSKDQKEEYDLDILRSDELRRVQKSDRKGQGVVNFKEGNIDTLYSTRVTRGMDFPGETCNSVVFTKYPYPNVGALFWKVLMKTNQDIYWDFYNDKALRELQQRLYRAVRFKGDQVAVLSPDSRVLSAVKQLESQS